MEVEYDLTADDIIAFNRYAAKGSVSARTYLCVVGLTSAAGLFVVVVVVARRVIDGVWMIDLPGYGVGIVALWVLFFMLLRWRSLERKHALRAAENGKLQKFTLRPEGIEHLSPLGAGITTWAAVKKIKATEDYLFIHISDISAFVVPKRAFQDEVAFQSFVTTAQSMHQKAVGGLSP
jgi:hypothetical protein